MTSRLTKWKDIWARFSGRGTYPHELSSLLLLPLRRLILSPAQLVQQLRVTSTSRVLEVGPGPGYFSVAVARAVPRGELVLVDLQREMLRKVRGRLVGADIHCATLVQAAATALPLRSGTFDAAFLVAVLGEVPEPGVCVAEVARVLRPGGRLVFAELPGDPDALDLEQLRHLTVGTGLDLLESSRVGRATVTTFRL